MMGYPLRFRFADDEWVSRLIDAARLISDRPVFAECSFEDILSFLYGKIASLVEMHLMSSITLDQEPAGWAGYISTTNDGFRMAAPSCLHGGPVRCVAAYPPAIAATHPVRTVPGAASTVPPGTLGEA